MTRTTWTALEAHGRQYPNCTYILRAQGKLYPRTCAECGLAGPCKLELDARMRYGWVDPSQAEMGSALRDAIAGGVGYLLDGVRISPERVQLVRPPVTPVPANHESGFVRVSRESLRLEARRLRFRAAETYGLGPAKTDAGSQMLHTASTLDVFADFASDDDNAKDAERYRRIRDTSMNDTIAKLPPEKAASITAATRQLIADEFDAAIDVEIAAGTLLAAMRGDQEGATS